MVGDRAGRHLRDRRHLAGMGGGDDAKPVADTPAASAPVEEKSEPKAEEPVAEAPETTQAPAPKPKPAPAPDKPTMTKAQEQAIGSAESYLDLSHFSKKGLIDQLTCSRTSPRPTPSSRSPTSRSTGTSRPPRPRSPTSTSSHFSRQGLIDQLKFEWLHPRRRQRRPLRSAGPLSRLVRVGPRLGGGRPGCGLGGEVPLAPPTLSRDAPRRTQREPRRTQGAAGPRQRSPASGDRCRT